MEGSKPGALGMIPALKMRLISLKLWFCCIVLKTSHKEYSAGDREKIVC